ncbi:hypothetical protein MRX96_036142 [Rhipicephalus microplus]
MTTLNARSEGNHTQVYCCGRAALGPLFELGHVPMVASDGPTYSRIAWKLLLGRAHLNEALFSEPSWRDERVALGNVSAPERTAGNMRAEPLAKSHKRTVGIIPSLPAPLAAHTLCCSPSVRLRT